MIEMRVVAEGRVGPVVMCDHCGRRIDDAGLAMVKFRRIHREPVGTTTEYLILHKGACDRATESPDLKAWMELGLFFARTVANSTPPDDRDPESIGRQMADEIERARRMP